MMREIICSWLCNDEERDTKQFPRNLFGTLYMRGFVFETLGAPKQWPCDIYNLNLNPADVPPAFARNINHGSFRGAPSDFDVITFIKKHICDSELSQEPMLVLTNHRAARMDLVPTTKLLVESFKTSSIDTVFLSDPSSKMHTANHLFFHPMGLLSTPKESQQP